VYTPLLTQFFIKNQLKLGGFAFNQGCRELLQKTATG